MSGSKSSATFVGRDEKTTTPLALPPSEAQEGKTETPSEEAVSPTTEAAITPPVIHEEGEE